VPARLAESVPKFMQRRNYGQDRRSIERQDLPAQVTCLNREFHTRRFALRFERSEQLPQALNQCLDLSHRRRTCRLDHLATG
jgi:hypothetical protein